MPFAQTAGDHARGAITDARHEPFWLAHPDRPAARPPLDGVTTADLVVVGAGLIAWTAAQMIFDDARIGYAIYSLVSTSLDWLLPGLIATSVLVFGYIRQLGRKQSRKESARA